MIAVDPVVTPFSIDVPDAVKMRIIAVVDLADDAPTRSMDIAFALFCEMVRPGQRVVEIQDSVGGRTAEMID